MEKKRVFSKSLILLAITSIMLFAMSITSMAATNQTMNVHQTGGDDDTITLEWSSRLGYDHYDVEFSQDGVNWAYMEDTSSPKVTIYNNLSTGSTYYARVKAYKQGHILGDHDESTALVSESILVCTAPNKPTNLKQTKATKNSITMTWNAVPGATSYQIFIWEDWSYQLVGASNTNSVTIKGLSASSRRSYYVASVKNVNGYDAVGSKSDDLYAKTLPKKVTRMAINNLWANIRSCQYKWTTVENADGYQYEVTSLNGKKKYYKKTTTSDNFFGDAYPVGTFTKARVRAYVEINGKKTYGPWSDYEYVACSKKVTGKGSKDGKKITLKWKKVSGVSEYQIYVSTKEKKGYKKAATVSSKKTSYTITKYNKKKLKKGQKYYVQLRYVGKNGKKKVVSNIYSYMDKGL